MTAGRPAVTTAAIFCPVVFALPFVKALTALAMAGVRLATVTDAFGLNMASESIAIGID